VTHHPQPSYTLGIERDGHTLQVPFHPAGATVDDVLTDSPAANGGIQKGDVITAVNGTAMPDGDAIGDYVRSHGGKPTVFTVLRDGKSFNTTVTPLVPVGEPFPMIGLVWADEFGIKEDTFGQFQLLHPSPLEQIRSGMMSIFETVGAIASRKSDVKLQHMGGPLMMMRVYYMFFQSREGWRLALWFSVVINVNLALLNMLPIPVLDGGHIMLAIVEGIGRRPISVRVLTMLQTSCFVVVIGFMLYIAFFDVQEYYIPKGDQMRFEPKAAVPAQSH
jgi:regulator of sigma E protease